MAERRNEQIEPTPRMRILFICGAGIISGREIATLNLIQGLQRRGHDVRCVASTWGDGKLAERLKAQGVPFVSLPLGFISKTLSWSAAWMTLDQLRRIPRLWLGFRRYLKEFQPDVVVQTNFHHVFLLWPLLDARKTFFHVHDGFPVSDFYRRLARFLSRRLHAFVGVSRYIAQNLMELGIAPEKVSFVHNGVAIKESMDEEGTASRVAAEQRDEVAGAVRIGIIGQVGEWKGHDDLIEALKELREAGLPFSCTIYGEGKREYTSVLEEKIGRYNLSENVEWGGFVSNPQEMYAAIDICVVPSRFQEPFGLVAAEAAHFGVPVVATRRGGLCEIVQDGVTGYLVEAEAPHELAEKLRLLIEDAALRRKMGRAGRQFASARFTVGRMAEQMEAVFARVGQRAPQVNGKAQATAELSAGLKNIQ
jgi:glycosyltransferase involved in cell wall biosynthesis